MISLFGNCPNCDSTIYNEFRVAEYKTLYQCSHCSTVFTDPEKYYGHRRTDVKHITIANIQAHLNAVFSRDREPIPLYREAEFLDKSIIKRVHNNLTPEALDYIIKRFDTDLKPFLKGKSLTVA